MLLAPIAAAAAIAIVAGVLRLQRSSQRRLLGRVAPAGCGGTADILYFTGENCTICHVAQRPALRRLHEAITDLQVTEIDVGVDPQAARAYRVMTLPTTVVLDARGRVSALNAGFVGETLLRTQVEAARTAGEGEAVA
ncbi:MAG TPA: thioredoxin family protein [Candidatus Dormibacteraeota bacterium]|nr:thioredoxin family protein [Candidatus Dormibacteraeota bacterium]